MDKAFQACMGTPNATPRRRPNCLRAIELVRRKLAVQNRNRFFRSSSTSDWDVHYETGITKVAEKAGIGSAGRTLAPLEYPEAFGNREVCDAQLRQWWSNRGCVLFQLLHTE